MIAVTATEEVVTKAPVAVEKKGKARDKELVGSIPKVRRCVSSHLHWAHVWRIVLSHSSLLLAGLLSILVAAPPPPVPAL